ncbi:MAG: YqeG family HAD IIIA-type phosphatase [Bacilli bacterium]|nr:YqeG family HAD IIIA-type phosphatase [Bacilli bacterium]
MFKRFIPFAHANSIYEIDPSFYKKYGVKTLLVDLDNTLDSYKLYNPTEKAINLVNKLKKEGINVVVISNNRGPRVSSYAKGLNVPYIWSARKPFPNAINRYIKQNSLKRENVMFVGDQMMTDVLATHYAHVRIVLTEKIVKEDQWTTHINRIFGKRIRKYHAKHGNLRDWRTL